MPRPTLLQPSAAGFAQQQLSDPSHVHANATASAHMNLKALHMHRQHTDLPMQMSINLQAMAASPAQQQLGGTPVLTQMKYWLDTFLRFWVQMSSHVHAKDMSVQATEAGPAQQQLGEAPHCSFCQS